MSLHVTISIFMQSNIYCKHEQDALIPNPAKLKYRKHR